MSNQVKAAVEPKTPEMIVEKKTEEKVGIVEKVKKNSTLLVIAAGLLSLQVYNMSREGKPEAPTAKAEAPAAQQQPQAQQVIYVPQAAPTSLPGQQSGSFKIMGGYLTQNGLLLLNDMSDYKAASCRTLVIDTNSLTQFKGQAVNSLKGKTVSFQAVADEYKGKAQLKATAASIQ